MKYPEHRDEALKLTLLFQEYVEHQSEYTLITNTENVEIIKTKFCNRLFTFPN